uniref:Putative peptidase S1 family n=1 Tax=uncultured bacterium CBNPD1 BAC clone 1664 TaxID=417310 RepID=B1N6M4_9BACT|nr:putative peptidase S1 family [uncultured bacterium CBNPD1 BAC clone 1664]
MVRRPGGQGHVGQGRVHRGAGGHDRPVGEEEVGDLVRLAPAVHHRGGGIAAHAGRAHLVDAVAGRGDVFGGLFPGVEIEAAGGREHLPGVPGRLAHHPALIGAMGGVDDRHGHSPGVLARRREGDAVVGIGQALAEGQERHRPGQAARGLRPPGAHRPALHAEAAQVGLVRLRHIGVARDVDARRALAGIVLVLEARPAAGDGPGADMVHQVAPHLVAAIGETPREGLRHRVQEDGRGVDAGRIEEDHPRRIGAPLAGVAVDHPHAGDSAESGVILDRGDDGVGHDGQVAGGQGGGKGGRLGREIGAQIAAVGASQLALAPPAAKILMQLGGAAEVGGPTHDHAAGGEGRFDPGPHGLFDAVHRPGGKEVAVGQLTQAVIVAADPGEGLHMVIPGGEVVIPDRPVHPVPVLQVGLEVLRRPAVGLPAPGEGAAAQLVAPDPAIGLAGRGLVGVVEVAGPEGLVGLEQGVGDAHVIGVVLLALLRGDLVLAAAAAGGEVVAVVLPVANLRPPLEHQDLQAPFAQLLGDPAAADPRPDDDGVKHAWLPGRRRRRRRQGGDGLPARHEFMAKPLVIALAGEKAGDGGPVDLLPVVEVASPGGAGGVDMADQVEVGGQGADQVPLHQLHVIAVVKEAQARVVQLTHDFGAEGRAVALVAGVVDLAVQELQEQAHAGALRVLHHGPEALDAGGDGRGVGAIADSRAGEDDNRLAAARGGVIDPAAHLVTQGGVPGGVVEAGLQGVAAEGDDGQAEVLSHGPQVVGQHLHPPGAGAGGPREEGPGIGGGVHGEGPPGEALPDHAVSWEREIQAPSAAALRTAAVMKATPLTPSRTPGRPARRSGRACPARWARMRSAASA